jgi:hypothetical protein
MEIGYQKISAETVPDEIRRKSRTADDGMSIEIRNVQE